MKKLIVTIGGIAFAMSMSAATIRWGGDIALEDGVTALSAGTTAYLIRGATQAAAAVSTISIEGTNLSKWTTDTGASVISSFTPNDSDLVDNFHFEAAYAITGASDAGYYSIVVVDGSAAADGLKGSYNYAGQNTLVDPTSGSTVDLLVGDNWATSAAWLGQNGFTAVSFNAVPEPTSGLLMLVGLAGLALKRKRA